MKLTSSFRSRPCISAFYVFAVVLLVFVTFTGRTATAEHIVQNQKAQLPTGKMAVLPFVKGDFAEKFRAQQISPLICPINQVCIDLREGDESIEFMKKIDRHLFKRVKKKVGANLFPMTETTSQMDTLPIEASTDTILGMALALAEKMNSDYVLVPILWDYSEREGSKFAADQPASVSFTLYLVAAEQGKRVWKESFDKTQQSLTDDILKAKEVLKMGGKWITAEELAKFGLSEVLEKFPLKGIQ